jgi:predicted DNA binding CopG/RHH family protein
MTVSKAQQKAVNKYVREKYDRINVTMPKGKKEEIQSHAARHGVSVTAYINAAIDEKMERYNDAE